MRNHALSSAPASQRCGGLPRGAADSGHRRRQPWAPRWWPGIVLGLVNAIIRPLLILLTLPATLLTLGLFIFVVNAICLGARRLVRARVHDQRLLGGAVRRARDQHHQLAAERAAHRQETGLTPYKTTAAASAPRRSARAAVVVIRTETLALAGTCEVSFVGNDFGISKPLRYSRVRSSLAFLLSLIVSVLPSNSI